MPRNSNDRPTRYLAADLLFPLGAWGTAAIMRLMSIQTASEIVSAAEHLPSGASLVDHQCAWEDYEQVLETLLEHSSLHACYDSGRLEIVSPLPEHEEYERLIEDLVLVFCQICHVKLEKRGGATWKKRTLAKGVEPDASFYN